MNSTAIQIIEQAASSMLTGPVAKTFVSWLTGFIGALPAIEAGAVDAKGWLEAGFRIVTEGETSVPELQDILTKLKAQVAATDAQVAADKLAP